MKKNQSILSGLSGLLIFVLLWIMSYPLSSWAGQVITEDARLWARKVLKEEKTLQTVEGKNTLAVLYFQNKTGQMELDPLQKRIPHVEKTHFSRVKDLQL